MAAGSSSAEDPLEEQFQLSAVESQQEYYEARGDADWELFEKNDRKLLLQKVAVALCGPPTEEGNLVQTSSTAQNSNRFQLQGYDLRSKEICMQVFKKICEQEIYSTNGKDLLVSILRVIYVCPSRNVPFFRLEPNDYWVDLHLKRGKDVRTGIFHVFCIRKCISVKSGGKGCRLYIDHDARVYKNWQSYLKENNLPKGVLVVPMDGEYTGILHESYGYDGTNTPIVQLSIVPTPALGIGAKVLSIADTASIAAPIGAVVGVLGALAVPAVAPAAMATAVGVGVVTGVYGIVRSSFRLADRSNHEQEIGLGDAEARGCWINILMSTVGLSFSAAGKLLSMAASSGTNLQMFINALNFFKFTSVATGFIGVANSLGEMIYRYKKYEESPSKLELFQFASSLLFFGIGVMSNQTAQDIVQDAQAQRINEIRDSLSSNVKRKIFDKVTAETRRLEGTIKGNSDVIRALKNIDNKDDFFAKLGRINKQVNKNKVRVSLTSDGSTLINNQHKFNIGDLDSLGKDGRNQLFAKYGRAKVTTKNAPTRIFPKAAAASSASTSREVTFQIRPEEVIKIVNFLIQLSRMESEFLAEILSNFTREIHDSFLLLCAELILSLTAGQEASMSHSDKDFRIRIVFFVFNYLKSLIGDVDPNDKSLCNLIKMFVVNGGIDKETILNIKDELMKWWIKRSSGNHRNGQRTYYDHLDIFVNVHKKKDFMMIRAGEIIEVGDHKIIVKLVTIEKLEEWLVDFDQQKCDLFMELCFKIISILSHDDIEKFFSIHPDEDILMHVARFFINIDVLLDLFSIFIHEGKIDEGIVLGMKADLMTWCEAQKIRKHIVCNTCDGIHYTNPVIWE